ncbi:MAG: T9SS type A sorting domain-containing protein [Sphingobacteriales bacterium]|nr:MAG: T9SS type A sorting domain-containing protein [Sphingobacteriales bacterium]
MRIIPVLLILVFLGSTTVQAGKKLRVLFVGNSYTYVNNMPQIAANIAAGMGDTLEWQMEAPGGATFMQHWGSNAQTLAKIAQGNWDYMVLQEQSQTPALPDGQVQMSMYPYAKKLDSFFRVHNPCGQSMYYMTWGRKNGDAANCTFYTNNYGWPYYCSYQQMDSIIRVRYETMASNNQGQVAAVGAVWRYLRGNNPAIELYDADESHPSLAGSYAAACSFYSALFKANPNQITVNAGLSATDANAIKAAVKAVVFDSIPEWHIGAYRTEALFSTMGSQSSMTFVNLSMNAVSADWDFGDGQTSTLSTPIHSFSTPGVYIVRLVATATNGCTDTAYTRLDFATAGIDDLEDSHFATVPNPSSGMFSINVPGEPALVIVRDITGRTVWQRKGSGVLQADLCDQPKGMYLVQIVSEQRSLTLKHLIR